MKHLLAFAVVAFITSCTSAPPLSPDARIALKQTLYDAEAVYTGTLQVGLIAYLSLGRCSVPKRSPLCHERAAEVPLNNANKAASIAFAAAWNTINTDPTAPVTMVDMLVTAAKNAAAAVVQAMQLYSVPLVAAKGV